MICEKCNIEMSYFKNGQSQGWTCPNCGNSLVTSYLDDMQMDEIIYTVTLLPNSHPSVSTLKIVSKITGFNILDSKKITAEGGEIFNGKATKIIDVINRLKSSNLLYSINPAFPYKV